MGMRKIILTLGLLGVLALLLGGCAATEKAVTLGRKRVYFMAIDPAQWGREAGIYFIRGVKPYLMTRAYGSGPAVLLSLLDFYRVPGIVRDAATENRLWQESGNRGNEAVTAGFAPGLTAEEMKRILENYGFAVTVTESHAANELPSGLLLANLRNGIPTPVKWIDDGGRWALAVGYDSRGTDDPADDVLLLIDPDDIADDAADGYRAVNFNKFLRNWCDPSGLRKVYGVMVTAVPKGRSVDLN